MARRVGSPNAEVTAVATEAKSVGERGGRSTPGILPIVVVLIPRPAKPPSLGANPMPVTEAQVIDALRPVQDPELHRSIVDLDMVRHVGIDGGRVDVTVALTI